METSAPANTHLNHGNALVQLGQLTDALASYDRALAVQPDMVAALCNKANVLARLGQHAAALASCERAIVLGAMDAQVFGERGNAQRRLGQWHDALASYGKALALAPRSVPNLHNRGGLLYELGQFAAALDDFTVATDVDPNAAAAWLNRGCALYKLARWFEALECFDRAVALDPTDASTRANRGTALHELGRQMEALAECEHALALERDHVPALIGKGYALNELGRHQEALDSFDHAAQLAPGDPDLHYHRANALVSLRRHEEALACYGEALQHKPGDIEMRWNESLCRLAMGDYERGWPGFQLRWDRVPHRRDFAQPLWLGGADVAGKTILLHPEQGFGDVLQCCRYAPLLAEAGARVIMEVQPALVRLLSRLPGIERVIASGEALPAFDCHCPVVSLPTAFHVTLDSLPGPMPYLSADPAQTAQWRNRLAKLPGTRVGLVWAGSTGYSNPNWVSLDRRRSISLRHFSNLGGVPGVSFVSLQKGQPAEQARELPAGMVLHDWTDELEDFADTAALVAALDLVIGVDTSVVHLAGGLGKPVWVLNRFDACWRWLRDRADSPWYPSARLFRQPAPGDWASVIETVASALRQRLADGS